MLHVACASRQRCYFKSCTREVVRGGETGGRGVSIRSRVYQKLYLGPSNRVTMRLSVTQYKFVIVQKTAVCGLLKRAQQHRNLSISHISGNRFIDRSSLVSNSYRYNVRCLVSEDVKLRKWALRRLVPVWHDADGIIRSFKK